MRELFLEIFSEIDSDGVCLAPLETVLTLFTYGYCDHPNVVLTFVVVSDHDGRAEFKIKIPRLVFKLIYECDIDGMAANCKLPVLVCQNEVTAVAGLCGVLRRIIKLVDVKHPLLGFKQSCLYACAESSLWTKFCEVDIIATLNEFYRREDWDYGFIEIPHYLARFEIHMSQPVKIHNIQKEKQDLALSTGGRRVALPDSRLAPYQELDHKYSEGPRMTLADVMLFPGIHIVFECFGSTLLKSYLPLTYNWYENMLKDKKIESGLSLFAEVKQKFKDKNYVYYFLPDVELQSFYKGDLKKNEQRRSLYSQPENIDKCFKKIIYICNTVRMQKNTFGSDIDFDWKTVPGDGSHIPAKRFERKGQQLQNLTKAVLKIARSGDIIVDFCSGSGHLGLIIAHALPRCEVVLLENKEQSLDRAKERAEKLKLSNVFFYQSNVDYFKGNFNIGVSLHACGVATDLVIERCVQQQAAFVCCPCCYGSIESNHVVRYPRSEAFRNSGLSLKEYYTLSRTSDQTFFDDSTQSYQGSTCMGIIDADRCLRAKEVGYSVFLSKLDPPSCTPKNNLLVGIPNVPRWSTA